MRHVAARIVQALPTSARLRTDGDLLAGFLTHGNEDDFAELVRRHGPLVWGVCRRALPDPADAEDAFQATLLVLVRRGRKLTGYPTIGPWLHKVAAWTARNVRRRNARRLAKHSALPDQLPAPRTDADLALDIDAALLALPDKYRSPIVLCHLLGYSRADAAERLGCPEGTLSVWLSRGLAKLRMNLGGLDPAKPLGLAAITAPAVLTSSVVRAAVASRVAAATAAVSVSVSQVVEGVIRMFWVQKATAASAAVVAVFALGVGVGISGRQAVGVAGGQEKGAQVARSPRVADVNSEIATLEAALSECENFLQKVLEIASQVNDKAIADRLYMEAEVAAAKAKAIREKIDSLKAARQKVEADEIADLTKKTVHAEAVHNAALRGVEKAMKFVELGETKDATPEQRKNNLAMLDRFRRNAETAAAELKVLHAKLDKLKSGPAADLYRRRVQLEAERVALQTQLTDYRAKLAVLPRLIEENETALNRLDKQLADLTGKQPATAVNPRGHLELTIASAAPSNLIGLREFDAQGNEILSLTLMDPTKDGVKLARLLSRTRADPAGPSEIRVVVDPRVSLGWGPIAALKACDTAGYKTVKFTGYIPAGGFTRELKPDEKGEVPGYTRHDNAERTAESLIKEFEEGRRRF